jgi:hypothetical protein
VQSSFEINTRDDGEVEVVVRPSGARPVTLVGFASQRSAEDWIRTRVAREDRRLAEPPGDAPRLH